MTEIPEELVEEQIEELRNDEEVEAVAIVGSYARNPKRDHKDLDLYAVVEGDWRTRETKKIDAVVVEKFFNSRQWAEKKLESDDWVYSYRSFRNADVRHDPKNIFQELEEKAEEVREEELNLSENEKKEIAYTIWEIKQDISSEDVSQKRFMLNQLFDYLLEKQYLLKNQVPVKENYRLEKMKKFDGYMYKLSQDFLLASSTMEKEKNLEKIIEHVSRNLPDLGPEWETGKEYLD
jgi:predicted nucleotidyltransferase